MPRKGENIRKRKDGRWEARYEKCRDQNGRISGTEGYIYVPAPWWKTDYFEVRFENSSNNKRYFYQLDGEGIRYELADFVKTIEKGKSSLYISEKVSEEISNIMEAFQVGNNLICI